MMKAAAVPPLPYRRLSARRRAALTGQAAVYQSSFVL